MSYELGQNSFTHPPPSTIATSEPVSLSDVPSWARPWLPQTLEPQISSILPSSGTAPTKTNGFMKQTRSGPVPSSPIWHGDPGPPGDDKRLFLYGGVGIVLFALSMFVLRR